MIDDLPDCSEPNYEKWPNNINAMLADIKRYRRQKIDPAGYREDLRLIEQRAKSKTIKGAPKV